MMMNRLMREATTAAAIGRLLMATEELVRFMDRFTDEPPNAVEAIEMGEIVIRITECHREVMGTRKTAEPRVYDA